MTYDFQDPNHASPHTALWPHTADAINYYISKGCPASKILLGIPTYGRTVTLEDDDDHEYGAPIDDLGHAGPYTHQDGFMGYNEFCEKDLKREWEKHHVNGSAYAYLGDQWISYESVETVNQKVHHELLLTLH